MATLTAKALVLTVLGLLLGVNAQAEMVGAPSVPRVPPVDADGSYTLSWSRSATPRAGYLLEEATSPDFSANLKTAYVGGASRVHLKGRYAGNTYYYRLKATLAGFADSPWQPGGNGCAVPHAVEARANAGGALSPSGRVTIPVGASQEFLITPAVGFHTESVLVDGVARGAVATVNAPADLIPNAKNKHAIKVKFAVNRYEVSAEAGAGGKITPAGVRLYRHGKKATYTIKPDRGYRIAGVQVNGAALTGLPACGSFKLALVATAATRITATFAPGCTDGRPDPGPTTWQWRNPLPQGNHLNAIAYGGGVYVAVGEAGALLSSADGATWVNRASAETRTLNAVAYGNGLFTAVGYDGALLTSVDGAFWTQRAPGTAAGLLGVAYGNGRFVAAGVNTVVTSYDGIHWTATPSDHTFRSTTFGNGVFVAVLSVSDGDSFDIATSPDGMTWSLHTSGAPPDRDLFRVFYGNGLFVGLGGSGNILTSPDGTAWTHRSGDRDYWLYGVAYGNGLFLAVGGSGQTLVSTDGTTWAEQAATYAMNPVGVVFSDGRFLAVGGWGRIASTLDGITWTAISSAATDQHLREVAYGGGQFVAVGDHGAIVTSPDGTAWTARDSGTDVALYGVAWGNGTYVAVGENSTFLSSPDGVVWTAQPSPPLWVNLSEVAFGNGIFIASGYLTYQIRTYTSPDGVNWTNGPEGIHAVTFANGRFLAWETHQPLHSYMPTYNAAVTSTDGLTWTTVSASQDEGFVSAMTRSDRLFAAIGGGCPQGQCVTTSPDGVTWTDHPVWTVDALSGIAYGGGSYVAVGNNGTVVVSADGSDWLVRRQPIPYYLFDVAYGNGTFVAVGANGVILQSGPIP